MAMAMVARSQSKSNAIPVLWLLIWSHFQPLVSAQTLPIHSRSCSSESASSCMQNEGVSLLQARSQMAKVEAHKSNSRRKSFKDDCIICKEIAKEVKTQVKGEVSTIMKKAKITIEQEFLRQVLLRHNSTMEELEKIVEKQVSSDLKNADKIQKLEDKVEENFVEDDMVKKMNTQLDSIETRLTTVETEMKEIKSVIQEIKDSVAKLTSETEVFVNSSKTKMENLLIVIKETSTKSQTQVLNKVVKMINEETVKFSELILQKTEKRITESVSTTLVKVEHLVQENIEREKEAHEIENVHLKEKIEEKWEETTVIIKELQEVIKEATESQVTNQKEIAALKDSLEETVTAVAKKVVGEHSEVAEGSLSDLGEHLDELAVTIEEEMDMAIERDDDIAALREMIEESQNVVVQKTEEFIKKETSILVSGSNKAIDKLKEELDNVKSSSSKDKEKMNKLMEELTTMKDTVAAGKEERIKNTQSLTVLQKDVSIVKEMVSEVKTDLEIHADSSQKQILEEVKILLDEAQKSTIEKTKELSVKEMMTEIDIVKESLETKLKSITILMEEDTEKAHSDHEEQQKKLIEKLEALKKQVDLNTETNEEIKVDQDGLKEAIGQLDEIVELGKEEHDMTKADISDLKEFINSVAEEVEEHEGQIPSKDELEKLESAVTKINAKVISASDKIEKQSKLREMSVIALEDRVTANEDHLDELEEELSGMGEDLVDISGIMKEINKAQGTVQDEAVEAALKAVGGIVKSTTESVIKESMDKVRVETKEMINQVTSSVEVLKQKMASESEKRTKADEQLSVLQKKVTSLTSTLEQKADVTTIDKVSKMVVQIQSTLRSEKETRVAREKQTSMIKRAMVSLFKRTEIKEKEVKTCREVHEVHHIHHVHKVESKEKLTAVSKQVLEVEAAADAEISKLKAQLAAAKEKLAADEASRLSSDASLKILEEQTMELFKRVASNSQKIAVLDAQVSEKIDALSQSLNEVSIKMQVSEQASQGDLARIQKMLKVLMADLAAEESARKSGDTAAEKTIMSRVQLLIEELVAVKKVSSSSSSSNSSSHCSCKTVSENGVSKTVCTKDGEEVPSCDSDLAGSIKGGSSSSSTTGTESSSSETSSSETVGCQCEATFKDGKFEEICKKGGKVVPKSECGEMGDLPTEGWDNNIPEGPPSNSNSESLEDMMEKLQQ